MSNDVLHDRLPVAPWLDPATWRLPGVQPLSTEDWLIRDEAFAGQMQLRDRLIAETPDLVHACRPSAESAARECLDLILATLSKDPAYRFETDTARRPDGQSVDIDRDHPLLTIGRLMQADVCLLEPGEAGHVLTGAILCFPANWTLAEKIGRPMGRIHQPVLRYDSNIAARVQRMFDGLRAGSILWRANAFLHEDAALFAPRREADRTRPETTDARFLRSERQTLRKLPKSQAIVFTIHTIVVPLAKLSEVQRQGLVASGIRAG